MADKTIEQDTAMTHVLKELEAPDIERLRRIAQNRGMTDIEALKALIQEADNQSAVEEDEKDPEEKAFNDAVRTVLAKPEITELLENVAIKYKTKIKDRKYPNATEI